MFYILVAAMALTGIVIVVLRAVSLAQALMGEALPLAGSSDDRGLALFDQAFTPRPGLTLLHIVPGLMFMILGPLQFVAKIRVKHLNLHRWCGRIYVASGLLVGVTALILGIVVGFGGPTETAAVTFFSLLFLIFLGLGVFRIRRSEVSAHREWMIRAFALGLAVTTMRPIAAILLALTDMSFSEILGISFWLGFSLHLIVAELWVNITRTKQTFGSATEKVQQGAPANVTRR
jgi:uncharacterized membrane protein